MPVKKPKKIDFSDVKDGGRFSKTYMAPGDYLAVVKDVEDVESKQGDPMWLFTIQLKERKSATYPVYCKFDEKNIWKIYRLLEACGLNVPKKLVNVDPNKALGKMLGITLDDDDYKERQQSQIVAFMPASEVTELEEAEAEDEEEEEEEETTSDDEEEEEEEEEEPAPKKKKKKKVVEEEEDEELEELEIEDI